MAAACRDDDEVRSLMRPKNGLATMDSEAPTPATSAKLLGALFDAHEGVDLQCQRDQDGREEHQAGAHVRQRVERDKTPPDAEYRGRLALHRSLGCNPVTQSAPRGTRPGRSPANRPTRDDMMIRKDMVILPLRTRNPHATRPRRQTVLHNRLHSSAAAALTARPAALPGVAPQPGRTCRCGHGRPDPPRAGVASMAPSAAPQVDMHAADQEQNPLVTEGERAR